MKSVTLTQPAPRTDAEYEAAVEELLAEMRQINERMQDNQAAIERLRAESDVIRTETRAILASLGAKL